METIDISKPVSEGGWGISESNSAVDNSDRFNTNIASGQELLLPEGTYEFNMLYISGKNNVEFYGEPGTIVKFKDTDPEGDQALQIKNADNFNVHDLKFDGRDADRQGGVWFFEDSTNGILKNLEIRDAFAISCVVEGQGTHDVTVEDCTVHGQRHWSGNAKAKFLAGGWAHDITFKNCKTYSKSYYNPTTDYSPADHFDSDNGLDITYQNCYADGEGSSQGVGFWNEADSGTQQETSSYYYDCTAYKTKGGLGVTENSYAEAHNMDFIACSDAGWAVRTQGSNADLEIYDSTFKRCFSYYPHYRGGCIVIEGGVTIIDNCEFINTPNDEDYEEYNITLYTADASNDKPITIENNTFDRSIKGFNASKATGDVSVQNNTFILGTEIIQGGDYNWQVSGNTWGAGQESATTTAVNRPTSSTMVAVAYQSYTTSVQYNDGESLDDRLVKMRGAINADAGAYITAGINTFNNSITFVPKEDNSSDDDISFVYEFSAWNNGAPFNPISPTMS